MWKAKIDIDLGTSSTLRFLHRLSGFVSSQYFAHNFFMAYLNEMIVSDSESAGDSACTMLFRRIGQNPCTMDETKVYVLITKH